MVQEGNNGNLPEISVPHTGTGGNTGNGNHGSGSVIVPNPPSQLSMAQFLATRLQITDPNKRHWLLKPEAYEITFSLSEFLMGNPNTPTNRAFAADMLDLVLNEDDGNMRDTLLTLSLTTMQANYLNVPFDPHYFSLIDPYVEADLSDPVTTAVWIAYFQVECAILKQQNPTWPKWKIYWYASKEMVQLGLDLAGLVPVIGEVADLTNGVIYTIEGDGVNATLSYASAIPFVGWYSAGVKFAKRADGLKFLVMGTNNLITFGAANSKKFRAACGIAVGDATKQAHHIIPRGSQIIEHKVVQKAAQADVNQGFHIDQALNGIAVATWRNQPNHPNYNNRIYTKLQNYIQQNPNASPTQCYNQLMMILNQAKQAVINNPNTHLNDLVF